MRKNKIILSGLVLLLASVSFPACENAHSDIDITLQTDYSQIVEAIDGVDQSLTTKLGLIESAVSEGFADVVAAQALVQKAVASLSGTLSEKLAAVETAVRGGTSSLEIKLSLIEAAVTQGFADGAAQQALIRSAVASLSGTTDERLAQIAGAVKSQTGSLESKLALIEAALKDGLADEKTEQELLQEALKTLEGTLAERLQAIEMTMDSQAASLAAKLDLVDAALENGLTEAGEALALLRQAVEALDGTAAEKLAAVDTAIQRQTAALETKLGLIEAAVKSGFADDKAEQALLQQAVKTLGGTTEARLAAISNAIGNQSTTLSAKLGLIEEAVRQGLVDPDGKQDLIRQAIEALAGTVSEKLAAIDTVLLHQTDSLATKLGLIVAELDAGLADEATALGQLGAAITALAATLDDPQAAYSVAAAIDSISTRLSAEGAIGKVLSDLVVAVQGLNYKQALTMLAQALEDLALSRKENVVEDGMYNGHDYVEMGPNGLKWATCNVGAKKPEEFGDYFAWGETEPYYKPGHAYDNPMDASNWRTGKSDGYDWRSYFDYTSEGGGKFDKYTKNTKTLLDSENDAATANWGGYWRMPTIEEWRWLFRNCSHEWVQGYHGTSVNGLLFKKGENELFIPDAGFRASDYVSFISDHKGPYWTTSLGTDGFFSGDGEAVNICLSSVAVPPGQLYESFSHRYVGFPIRPVAQ